MFSQSLPLQLFKWPHAWPPTFPSSRRPDSTRSLPIGPDDFVFYGIFDWHERKNPLAIIEAFLRAFPNEADAVLVLKIRRQPMRSGPCTFLSEARLRARFRSTSRIYIIDEYWSNEEIEALHLRGDCYVSFHRSEGWCYPLFIAAGLGTPVISTAYSGPLDYSDPTAHSLIRFALVPVKEQYKYYNENMVWAEPDIGHGSELMRHVYFNRGAVRIRAEEASIQLRMRYSVRTVGELARARLKALT